MAMKGKGFAYYQVAQIAKFPRILQRELAPSFSHYGPNPKYLLALDDDPKIFHNGTRRTNAIDGLLARSRHTKRIIQAQMRLGFRPQHRSFWNRMTDLHPCGDTGHHAGHKYHRRLAPESKQFIQPISPEAQPDALRQHDHEESGVCRFWHSR